MAAMKRMTRPQGGTPVQSEIMARLAAAAKNGQQSSTLPVVVAPDKTILVGENFIIHPTSIEVIGQINRVKWIGFMRWVHSLEGTIQWGLGDMVKVADENREQWLNEIESEDEPESKYQFLLEETGYSYSSLRKFASFANRFPVFRRRNTLSYSHHVEVASLSDEMQDELLDRAEAEEWSRNRLRTAVQQAQLPAAASDGNTMISPAVDDATPLSDEIEETITIPDEPLPLDAEESWRVFDSLEQTLKTGSYRTATPRQVDNIRKRIVIARHTLSMLEAELRHTKPGKK